MYINIAVYINIVHKYMYINIANSPMHMETNFTNTIRK